eukprot:scaffold871_cov183-Pinguiococcus_pyrenoidosus.AAC.1
MRVTMTAAATTRTTTTTTTTRTRAMTMTTTTTTMRKAIAAGEGDGGSSKKRCELRRLAGKSRAATREPKAARRMSPEATALAEGTAEEARGVAERRVVLTRQARKKAETLSPLSCASAPSSSSVSPAPPASLASSSSPLWRSRCWQLRGEGARGLVDVEVLALLVFAVVNARFACLCEGRSERRARILSARGTQTHE